LNLDHHEDETGAFALWGGVLALIVLAGLIIGLLIL
jgi:hypothetical protein